MLVTTTVNIAAPIGVVFDVFTDLSQLPERIDGIISMEVLSGPEQMAEGTRWKETRKIFGKESTEEMWVSTIEKDRSYVVDAESHGSKYQTRYTFTEHDDGESTDVTMEFSGVPQSLMAKIMNFTAVFAKKSVLKMMRQDMLDLKTVCEQPSED